MNKEKEVKKILKQLLKQIDENIMRLSLAMHELRDKNKMVLKLRERHLQLCIELEKRKFKTKTSSLHDFLALNNVKPFLKKAEVILKSIDLTEEKNKAFPICHANHSEKLFQVHDLLCAPIEEIESLFLPPKRIIREKKKKETLES